jgi:hypothetical protein
MADHANLGLRSISVERVLYPANLLSQLRQTDLWRRKKKDNKARVMSLE